MNKLVLFGGREHVYPQTVAFHDVPAAVADFLLVFRWGIAYLGVYSRLFSFSFSSQSLRALLPTPTLASPLISSPFALLLSFGIGRNELHQIHLAHVPQSEV